MCRSVFIFVSFNHNQILFIMSKLVVKFIVSTHWYFNSQSFLGSIVLEDLERNIKHEYNFDFKGGGESNAELLTIEKIKECFNITLRNLSASREQSIVVRQFKRDLSTRDFNNQRKRYATFAGYETSKIVETE